jgi:hypothetical protein
MSYFTYMNSNADELDVHLKNVMTQITEAASKENLAAIKRLTQTASELQELKDQRAAIEREIERRIASLNGDATEVTPPVANQLPNGKGRQLATLVTDGMIRQNLLTLASSVRSGKIKVGEELIIEALPSGERFQTTLLEQGKKLRERGKIANFYRDAKVKGGDYVLLNEVTPGRWTLKKALPEYGRSQLFAEF